MLRLLRLAGIVLGALVGVVVIAFVAGLFYLRTSLPEVSGTMVLAGPAAHIEITRDVDGIPYIKAGSERDAAFALGFVHAGDRLFQMELMRRLGAGRLAELFG